MLFNMEEMKQPDILNLIVLWIKASENWTDETKDKCKRVGSSRKAFYSEAEEKLYDWVMEQRKKGLAVTSITLQISMFKILDR
jgi:hypothetical protein